jgi:hypothetical protein
LVSGGFASNGNFETVSSSLAGLSDLCLNERSFVDALIEYKVEYAVV